MRGVQPVLVFCAILLFGKSRAAEDQRVVNGTNASNDQFPWVAELKIATRHCTGSLVHPSHVLTVAHCMYISVTSSAGIATERKALPSEVQVLMGRVTKETQAIGNSVETIYCHVCYRNEVVRNSSQNYYDWKVPITRNDRFDVALLKLNAPYALSDSVKTIDLASGVGSGYRVSPAILNRWQGKETTVAGWGLVEPVVVGEPTKDANRLKYAKMRLVSPESTIRKYDKTTEIKIFPLGVFDKFLYQAVGDNVSLCVGDSGAPMTIGSVQIGVMQYTVNEEYGEEGEQRIACHRDSWPQVFTRVDLHRYWIDTIISTGYDYGDDLVLCWLTEHDAFFGEKPYTINKTSA